MSDHEPEMPKLSCDLRESGHGPFPDERRDMLAYHALLLHERCGLPSVAFHPHPVRQHGRDRPGGRFATVRLHCH